MLINPVILRAIGRVVLRLGWQLVLPVVAVEVFLALGSRLLELLPHASGGGSSLADAIGQLVLAFGFLWLYVLSFAGLVLLQALSSLLAGRRRVYAALGVLGLGIGVLSYWAYQCEMLSTPEGKLWVSAGVLALALPMALERLWPRARLRMTT